MGNIEGLHGSEALEFRIGWMGVLKAGDEEGIGFGSADLTAVRKNGAERDFAELLCICSISILRAALSINP